MKWRLATLPLLVSSGSTDSKHLLLFVVILQVSSPVLHQEVVDTLLPVLLVIPQTCCQLLLGRVRPQRTKVGKDVRVNVGEIADRARDIIQAWYNVLQLLRLLRGVEREFKHFRDGDAFCDVFLEHL